MAQTTNACLHLLFLHRHFCSGLVAKCALGNISIQTFFHFVVPQVSIWTLLHGHMALVTVQKPIAVVWVWKKFECIIGAGGIVCGVRIVRSDITFGIFGCIAFPYLLVPMQMCWTIHWHWFAVVANVISNWRCNE